MNDRIEDYFNEKLPPPERVQFEQDLRTNPQMAEEVAFYLKTKEVLRDQVLAERHAEWQKLPRRTAKTPVRRLTPWHYPAAAMIVLAMGLAWLWLSGTQELSRPQLAQAYVEQHLGTLPVQMGGETDSLQMAVGHYNEGKYPAALTIGEVLLERNANNAEALEVAGLAALRQQNYDQAIGYFHRLAAQADLYANPGKFYEAIAHLQRNRPLDKKKAEELLKEVVLNNLEGKSQAEEWLTAWEE